MLESAALGSVIRCRQPLTNELARIAPEHILGEFRFYRMPTNASFGGLAARLIDVYRVPGAFHPNYVETIASMDPISAKTLVDSLFPSLKRSKGAIKWSKGKVRGIQPTSYLATIGFSNGDSYDRATGETTLTRGRLVEVNSVEIYDKGIIVINCVQPD